MKNKGMALAEMLVAIIIIMVMILLYMKFVWKGSESISRETRKELSRQGVKTDNPQNVVDSAQRVVDKYNQKAATGRHNYGEENEQ